MAIDRPPPLSKPLRLRGGKSEPILDAQTAQRLVALNQEFYQTFALPFSATRQRLQPGVRRLLEDIPPTARVLDLGCGNGELWRALAERGHTGRYLGLDFSPGLLAQAAPAQPSATLAPEFQAVDLTHKGWAKTLPMGGFERITLFAVLHHLPGRELRLGVLRPARRRLAPGGRLYISNWQFLNSPRLRQRIQPWSAAGFDENQVDLTDYLLDWRSSGQGLRYVHHFSPEELEELAAASGFRVVYRYYSDGAEGNLGLYQVWEPQGYTV